MKKIIIFLCILTPLLLLFAEEPKSKSAKGMVMIEVHKHVSFPLTTPAQISDQAKVIAGLSSESGYNLRMNEIKKLTRSLSRGDIYSYFWFMQKYAGDDALSATQLNPVKNDVAVTLLHQYSKPPEFGWYMMGMFYDTTQDAVWRDYCIQFLGQWFSSADTDNEKKMILATLFDATHDMSSSLPGTAIISLQDNIKAFDEKTRDAFIARVIVVAESVKMTLPARITAIASCGDLHITESLPTLRKIISHKFNPVMLRHSSIGSLGKIGDVTDLPLLQEYMKSSDIRLKTAAKIAIKHIHKR